MGNCRRLARANCRPLQTPISFQGQSQGQFVDVMANPGPIQMPPGGGSASAGNDVFVVVPMNATEWIDSSTPGNTAVKASIAGGCSDVSVPTDLDSESACLDLGRHMLAGFLPADIRPWFASSK